MNFLKRLNIKTINISRWFALLVLIIGWSDFKELMPLLPWFILALLLDLRLHLDD